MPLKLPLTIEPFPEPYLGHPVYDLLMQEADEEFSRAVREANRRFDPDDVGFEMFIEMAEEQFMVRLREAEKTAALQIVLQAIAGEMLA